MPESGHLERLLLDHLPAAVVLGDAQNHVVYANRAAVDGYGCTVGAPLPRELGLADCRTAPLYNARELVGSITISLGRAHQARPSPALAEVGSRIAHARARAGLTQQELADLIGVSRRSLQGYEAGRVAPYRHLDRLATLLDRPRGWFLAEEVAHSLRLR
jgi:DNA-binding XRE family transcriptional regulator